MDQREDGVEADINEPSGDASVRFAPRRASADGRGRMECNTAVLLGTEFRMPDIASQLRQKLTHSRRRFFPYHFAALVQLGVR